MTEKNQTTALAPMEQFSLLNPQHLESIQRVAKMFAKSDLVPDMYRESADNPIEKAMANCVIAIEISNRIGAGVLMVMQNMTPIYGKPSWSSKFLIATVNTCGRFEPLQFEFNELGELKNFKYKEYETEWKESKNGKKYKSTKQVEKVLPGPVKNIQCIAFTSKKGSEKVLEGSPVSVEMAINEGWYTKNGSKWPNMTKQMLMYRAASFWTSTYAPELSMGIRTEEEIRDIVDLKEGEYEDVTNKVEDEIKAQGNAEEVSMDDEDPKGNENSDGEQPEEKVAEAQEPEEQPKRKPSF